MRRGFTLIELIIVVVVIGLTVMMAAPRFGRWADALATDRATNEVMAFYWQARTAAIFRGTRVRLAFAADSLVATFEGVSDSVFLVRPGPNRHGVRFRASRSVVRLYPNGFGLGAANTKIVLERGAAAESLTTSRLGRLKRWP